MPDDDAIRRVASDDVDGLDGWLRWTDEPEIRAVEATRVGADLDGWAWTVTLAVMEFVREEPLESEYRRRIAAALASVPGVTTAVEDDRETWVVSGNCDGAALVAAAALVVDDLADRARTFLGWDGPGAALDLRSSADLRHELQTIMESPGAHPQRPNTSFTAAEFTVTNTFDFPIDGRWLRLSAGSSATDPTQGGLMIFVSDVVSGELVGPTGYFATPRRAGPIELASVTGSSVTFRFPDDSTGSFSLETGEFE